eukprot:6743451-Pyramimonas_sp.AAC.1
MQELQAIYMTFGLSRHRLSTGLRPMCLRISRGLRPIPPPWCRDSRSSGYNIIQGCQAPA